MQNLPVHEATRERESETRKKEKARENDKKKNEERTTKKQKVRGRERQGNNYIQHCVCLKKPLNDYLGSGLWALYSAFHNNSNTDELTTFFDSVE